MKKLMIGCLILIMVFCFAGCSEAEGQNVEISTITDNMVYLKPVCPECDHISTTKSLNLCEGEDWEGVYQCEECGEIYDISVVR